VVVLCIIVILMGIILTVYTGVVRWSKHQVNGAVETRNYADPVSQNQAESDVLPATVHPGCRPATGLRPGSYHVHGASSS